MPTNLAPVYLDDARVQLQGDPKPRVSKIVAAAGGRSADGDLVVVRLREQGDDSGSPLRLEDVIDRSQDEGPVYLRCLPGGGTETGFAADERPPPQFGAATPGIAGQGAQDSAGDVSPDKQAKSDVGRRQAGRPPASGSRHAPDARPARSREGDGPVTSEDAD